MGSSERMRLEMLGLPLIAVAVLSGESYGSGEACARTFASPSGAITPLPPRYPVTRSVALRRPAPPNACIALRKACKRLA